jgi:hypothetical protein
VLTKYNLRENLDELQDIVTEARARRKAKEAGKLTEDDERDVWRPSLPPRSAVRAKTVPLLQRERDGLKQLLAEVSRF